MGRGTEIEDLAQGCRSCHIEVRQTTVEDEAEGARGCSNVRQFMPLAFTCTTTVALPTIL